MRSGDQVTGLPVIDLSTGEQVGVVKKLIFNRNQDKLLGLVINEGGWFKEAQIIPFEAIATFGEQAITIDDVAVITRVEEQARLREFIEQNSSIKGMRVMTEAGKEIGNITDIIFDQANGGVAAFSISDGLILDLVSGKGVLRRPESMVMGKDTVIVPDESRVERNRSDLVEFW